MGPNSVLIESLDVRIPGISREAGREIGNEVSERIAASLPGDGQRQRLGALSLRVNVPVGTPRNQIAKMIALSILEKLR